MKYSKFVILEFQSHAGSIEAGNPIVSVIRFQNGFNPTLVRLRLIPTQSRIVK